MEQDKAYKVYKIENGTVIDHIPAGKGLQVIKVLGLGKKTNNYFIALGMNLQSKKHDYKDLVKIENKELSEEEINKIALLAPIATMNIIRNSRIAKKYTVRIPENINGIIKCSNPNCITNNEQNITTKFCLIQKNPLKIRCHYCERAMVSGDIILL